MLQPFFDLTIGAFGPDLLKWGLDGNLFLWSLWPPQVSKLPRLSLFFSPPSSSLWSGQSEWFPGSGADQYGPEHHELGGPQGSRRGQRGRTQAQSHPAQPGLLQRLLPHPPVCGWVNREASTSTALILFHSLQLILRPDTHWYHSGSPHTHTHTKSVIHLFIFTQFMVLLALSLLLLFLPLFASIYKLLPALAPSTTEQAEEVRPPKIVIRSSYRSPPNLK